MRNTGLLRRAVANVALVVLLVGTSLWIGADVFFPDEVVREKLASIGTDTADDLWWWTLASVVAVAGLAIRRRRPLVAYALAAGAALAHLANERLRLQPIDLAAAITLYTLASLTDDRRIGAAALGAGLAGVGVLTWSRGDELSAAAAPALLLGIAWALGDNARTQRLHVATLEQRADDLERERQQRAQLAIAAERARIMRELHDVVAHGISVIVVQAQGGAAALRHHPDRTASALEHIVTTGRASLAEMRRLIGLAPQRGDAELDPQAGIGALPALIDHVREAGTEVTLRIDGEPLPLPASVDLSVYRIVQEALTNTLKHAGAGAQASVRLGFAARQLEIDVRDDGRGAPAGPVDGNGLRGIAERVGALGGTIDAGPRSEGGFAIHAVLPIAG